MNWRGRQPLLLSIPYSAGLIAVTGIGGPSIDVALKGRGGKLLAHWIESTDARDGPRPVIDRVKALLTKLLEEQLIHPHNVPDDRHWRSWRGGAGVELTDRFPSCLDGFRIREAFAREYAVPYSSTNDANTMALDEHWGGSPERGEERKAGAGKSLRNRGSEVRSTGYSLRWHGKKEAKDVRKDDRQTVWGEGL